MRTLRPSAATVIVVVFPVRSHVMGRLTKMFAGIPIVTRLRPVRTVPTDAMLRTLKYKDDVTGKTTLDLVNVDG